MAFWAETRPRRALNAIREVFIVGISFSFLFFSFLFFAFSFSIDAWIICATREGIGIFLIRLHQWSPSGFPGDV